MDELISGLDANEVATSFVFAVVTVITTALQSRISDANWRKRVLSDLELYDALIDRSKCEDDKSVADAVRSRAFMLADKNVRAPLRRKNDIANTVELVFSNSYATKIALAESAILTALANFGSASPSIPPTCYFLIPFGVFIDIVIFKSREREYGKPERCRNGGNEEPDEGEQDEEQND